MTVQDFFRTWHSKLESAACAEAYRSVELILMEVLACSRERLVAFPEIELSPAMITRAVALLERRLKHEPMAYILGKKEFMGREFTVSPSVLIPRPETELLIELAQEELRARYDRGQNLHVLDVGTGSGVIAICTKLLSPFAHVCAVDQSSEALSIARKNAVTHNVDVSFCGSDLLQNIENPLDMILANLPYVSESEFAGLDSGVRDYEPKQALVSGVTGLELTLRLMDEAKEKLNKDGIMICEIGGSQSEFLMKEAQQRGFSFVNVYNDLNQFPRVLVLSWSEPYGLR